MLRSLHILLRIQSLLVLVFQEINFSANISFLVSHVRLEDWEIVKHSQLVFFFFLFVFGQNFLEIDLIQDSYMNLLVTNDSSISRFIGSKGITTELKPFLNFEYINHVLDAIDLFSLVSNLLFQLCLFSHTKLIAFPNEINQISDKSVLFPLGFHQVSFLYPLEFFQIPPQEVRRLVNMLIILTLLFDTSYPMPLMSLTLKELPKQELLFL